jgi:tetratricopeptide (TPR) repeat protein
MGWNPQVSKAVPAYRTGTGPVPDEEASLPSRGRDGPIAIGMRLLKDRSGLTDVQIAERARRLVPNQQADRLRMLNQRRIGEWLNGAVPQHWEIMHLVLRVLIKEVTRPGQTWPPAEAYLLDDSETGTWRRWYADAQKRSGSSHRATAPAPEQYRRRRRLPGAPGPLFGRHAEVAGLIRRIEEHDPGGTAAAIHAITGMPGVGKTALALHLAHLVADRYPDGAIFLDLTGYHPDLPPMAPESALRHLLLAAGVPDDRLPEELSEMRAIWQRETAGRRMLVVLDNAADSDQLRPLMPAGAGGLVLVTSRRILHGIPDARFFPLRTLADLGALELLRSAGGSAVDGNEGAARRIVTLCGGLPLALLIAGAMLNTPGYDPAALADDLEAERDSLEEVPLPERDSSLHAAVHASIILSYQRMTTDLRRQFQLCGVFPGTELSAQALAAMAGELGADDRHTQQTKRRIQLAQRALRELANRNLLMLGRTGEFGPRWQQHDLVRVSARVCQRDDPLVDREASVTRLMDAQETTLEVINRWWFGAHPSSGRTGGLLNFSDQAQTLRWVVAERANLLASVDSGLSGAGTIARYLGPLLRDIDMTAWTKGDGADAEQAPLDRYADARHCFEIQYRTAERQDASVHHVKALALRQMADLDSRVARYERAEHQYREAAEASQAGKDYYGLAMSLRGLGSIGRLTDNYPLAVDSFRQAIALLEPLSYQPDPEQMGIFQLAYTIAELADVLTKLRRFDAALKLLTRAADLQRTLKNGLGLADVYWHQGDVLRLTGQFGAARDRFNDALALNRKLERPDMVAQAQWGLAQVEKDSGNPALAAAMFAEIAALWRGWGNDLQQARMLLGQADAERLSKQWHDARTHFDCARELCLRVADREGEAEAHEGLAKVGAATGDGSAEAHREAAIALYHQIGHPKANEL